MPRHSLSPLESVEDLLFFAITYQLSIRFTQLVPFLPAWIDLTAPWLSRGRH